MLLSSFPTLLNTFAHYYASLLSEYTHYKMALCDVLSLLTLNVFDLYSVIKYLQTSFGSHTFITVASVCPPTYNRFVKSSQ